MRGAVPRRAASRVEPARPPARRRLRAGEPRLALRQGPLRLRVGALRGARARARWSARTASCVECSWPEALDAAADGLRKRASTCTAPESVAVLGGARGTNEDAYVWARFAKGVHRHRQRRRAARRRPSRRRRARPAATRRSPTSTRAAAIVLLGPDLKEELPVLLPPGAARRRRARRAAHRRSRRATTGLTRYATRSIRYAARRAGRRRGAARRRARRRCGDDADRPQRRPRVDGRDGDVVVVLGRRRRSPSPPTPPSHAAAALAALPRRPVPRRRCAAATCTARSTSGSRPGFLPGGSRSTPAATGSTEAWGTVPAERRASTPPGSSRPRPTGQIHALVLLGADPQRRLPRPRRWPSGRSTRRRLHRSRSTRSSTDSNEPRRRLPARHGVGREGGSVTNLEGRVQRVGAARSRPRARRWPTGGSPPSSRSRFGVDFDLETVDEVQDEIARVAPAFAGVDAAAAAPGPRRRGAARSPSTATRSCSRPVRIPITDASWEPIQPGRRRRGAHVVAQGDGRGRRRAAPVRRHDQARPRRDRGARRPSPPRPSAAEAAEPPRGAPRRCTVGTGTRRARCPPAATRTLSASWRAARSTTAGHASPSVAVARTARRAEPMLLVHPQRPRPHRRRGRRRGARSRRRRGSLTLPVRADAAIAAGHRVPRRSRPAAGRRRRSSTSAAPVTDLRVETLR